MKVSPFLLKVRPYVLLLLYFVLGALVYSQVALALNPPKTFGGTVVNSDSSVPVDTAVTFKAYIATRTTEQLTQASTGCGYGSGFYQVELGNFTTAWAVGETLVVEFTNSVNSEKKTINVVLDNVNPQLYNVTLQAKVLQSIAVTAPAASFAVGESLQFTATGTYDDASTADLTASATWTVVPTPAGAAAFDGTVKGRLNGLKEGTGTIKASKDGVDSPTVNGTVTAFNGTVTVAANPTSIVANGVTTSAISATVKTSGNVNVVDGVSVAFAVTGGTGAVAPASATTVNGVAASTYTSSTTVGSGTVTATVGAKSGSSTVTLTHGPAAKITLVANPTTISSSAISESTLTATIRDANNNVVTTGAGATLAVTFAVGATTFGDIKTGEATRTAAAGVATSHVVSKVTGGGVIACTASSGALTQGTENVTTAPKVLQSIAIEIIAGGKVSTTSPKVGETVQFKATGTYKDNAGVISTEVITTSVTWNSSVTAKGTVAASGLFSALAVGATNVTAALLGKTSNAIAMSVQAAAAVVIDKTNLPTTIASGGTIDFAAVVSGGTGDGFNYSIEAGSPAGGTIVAGLFTAGPDAGVYTIKVTDVTSGASSTYQVKEAFTVAPANWTFKAADAAKTFTIAGAPATSTSYTWDIMDSATATTPVATPADYGAWSNGRVVANPVTKTNDLAPNAAVTAVKTFYVRVTVEDAGLAAAGLDKVTVGPFNIIPVATYTVTVTGAAAAKLSGANVSVEYPKGTIIGPVATDAAGEAKFTTLPDSGGNYVYTISMPLYVTQTKVSNLKAVPVTLVGGAVTITGMVQDNLGAPLVGATVSAYLPMATAMPTVYKATTVALGAYTINLPTGAATTGWTVVAANTSYLSVQKTGIDIVGGTAAVNFTGAVDGLAAKVLGSPDVDTGGGAKVDTSASPAGVLRTDVEVPAGGVATNGYIIIVPNLKATAPSTSTAASPTYVYDVKVTSDQAGTAPLAAADIKRIVLTLPIDLGKLKPGDLEKGVFRIYTATTQALLEAGSGTAVPVANIIATDYVGNGLVGSVTFRVDHLSFFGIGGGSDSAGEIASGCFIATAAYGSYFEEHVQILRNFRDVYLLTNDWGRAFVGFYYRHSPAIAEVIAKNGGLRAAVRLGLAPVVGVAYVTIHTTPVQKLLILLFLIGILAAGMVMILRTRKVRRVIG